ncbi:MAG: hypothetical protein HY286_13600 [Planctomycetes bacterium]|nr:hypothetical protein [Planctomycetota bacterium]
MKIHRGTHSMARAERGSALIVSVVIVMLAAALGAAMLQMQVGMTLNSKGSTNKKRAFYIAEAGISEAFLALTEGKSGNIATASVPAIFGDGVYWVEAHEQPDNKVALFSNALCGSGRFSISMVVQKSQNTIASLGFFANTQMTVGAGAIFDGYDSTMGTYDTQAHQTAAGISTGAGAAVNANSDITVNGPTFALNLLGIPVASGPNTYIFGDAHPGISKNLLAMPNTVITGSTSPNVKTLGLPAVAPPSGTSLGNAIQTQSTVTLEAGEHHYDKYRVTANCKLRLRGPEVFVLGQFTLDANAQLEFDTTDGPVLVYVSDYLCWTAKSRLVNSSKDPKNVAVLVNANKTLDYTGDGKVDPPVTVASTGEFYGTFYSPNAAFTWPAETRVYGTVAGKQLTYAQGARCSFDKALLKSSNVIKSLPVLNAWRVVSLPDTPLTQSQQDPLTKLKILGVTPIPSATAAAESVLHMTYMDTSGVLKTFTGDAKTCDWNLVGSILTTVWSTN